MNTSRVWFVFVGLNVGEWWMAEVVVSGVPRVKRSIMPVHRGEAVNWKTVKVTTFLTLPSCDRPSGTRPLMLYSSLAVRGFGRVCTKVQPNTSFGFERRAQELV